jgi:hypothetical protein
VRRAAARLVALLFSATLLVAVVVGWLNRDEGYLTPKEGAGYWLGIAGSLAMLLLLMYSLAKRTRSQSLAWRVTLWFPAHVVLGLVGPILILFHSNFTLGALNSNIALFVMLIVVGSGIVGRFLLRKINRELYSRKARIETIVADAHALTERLGYRLPLGDAIFTELDAFTAQVVAPRRGALTSFWSMAVMGHRLRILRRRLLVEVRRLARAESDRVGGSRRERRQRMASLMEFVDGYAGEASRVMALAFYERLFALWHAFHLPLFLLLVAAAVIHVVAVHLY